MGYFLSFRYGVNTISISSNEEAEVFNVHTIYNFVNAINDYCIITL